MLYKALRSGWIISASQDSSWEFISLLACICADRTALPLALIYKSEFHNLQNTWVQDFGEKDKAYFAASANSWSCNKLGVQ